MLSPTDLHDYQKQCIIHQLQHDDSMLWLGMGLGKEQPNNEPILTPDGWVTMGDISVDDKVISEMGEPINVLNVFPQGDKEVLTISFNDGSKTRCGWDHIWAVKTNHDITRGMPWRKMTTREIVNSGLYSGGNSKYIIPLCKPVQYPHVKLPIDPYTLGVLLGDGCISERGGPMLCTDIETLIKCKTSTIVPHETSPYTGYGYVKGVKQHLRDLNLMGKRSWEKHVPEMYLRSSPVQRLNVLQGLLDTDGSPITCGGGLEFSSTSEMLTDAVVELTNSLGGVARKTGPRVTFHQNGEGRPSWRVNVKLPIELTPFTLGRKLKRWIRPTKYKPQRRIISIEVTGFEQSTCISVDSPSNLYLTRDHIVTHNTAVTLTTIVDRMRAGHVKKTLIFGPLRVIQSVWAHESRKWEHTKHLRFSLVHGTKEKRLRALFTDADIYLINYENTNWLAEQFIKYYISQNKEMPFQMVVYDEVSKLKNSTSLRMSGGKRDRKNAGGDGTHEIKLLGWRKIIPHFKYRTGLTGTPASNGYLDLHGQFLAVDGGERLGEYITNYKDNYFTSDHSGWKHTVTELGKEHIESKISDITVKMDSRDYLDLPDVKIVNMMVDLPIGTRKQYIEIEKNMFTQLDNGTEIEVFSRSSVSNKCLQFCNGSPYISAESSEFEEVHNAKLDALEEVLEEAAGSPVLCSYSFTADADRIMKKFKKYKPVNLTKTPSKDTDKVIQKWNNGEIGLLIGHPASMGYGIDRLQESGHIIVWFGLNWSLELYDQMCGRIDRQGQDHSVSIIRILCNDTVDLAVADAIERKTDDQEGLKAALQRYRKGLTKNTLEVNFY